MSDKAFVKYLKKWERELRTWANNIVKSKEVRARLREEFGVVVVLGHYVPTYAYVKKAKVQFVAPPVPTKKRKKGGSKPAQQVTQARMMH